MRKILSITRKCISYGVIIGMIALSPLAAFAEEAPASTDSATPPPPTTTYDPVTGHWSTDSWWYNPATGKYEAVIPPDPAPAPVAQDTAATSDPVQTQESPSSSDTTVEGSNDLTHNVTGDTMSGDAMVSSNTAAGSASSGDTLTQATIMNALNSVLSTNASKPVTFTSDIYGDVHGDIELAPQILSALAHASTTPDGASSPQNVSYDVTQKNNLTNNVDLSALSGNASVLDNTLAGDATSGDATAIANVINIVNSVIAANKSFVGTINIHGNLNGDILMSKSGSPQLLASNASAPFSPGQLFVNQNNVANVLNNVSLTADTGNATVDQNTRAGNATTGTAATNLVVFNLTGHQVVAKNSLLVFVNVMGKWVGIIVDAPTGATAAVLGDDVASSLFATPDGNMTVSSDNATQITNNIKVRAGSGDATVAGNTSAGNATSGNATAGASILNLANSSFALSDWFGVLFINVLGTWYGSFGLDTAQGNVPESVAATTSGPPPMTVPNVLRFIPRAATSVQSSQERSEASNETGIVLAEAASPVSSHTASQVPTAQVAGTQSEDGRGVSMPMVAVVASGLILGVYLAIRAFVLMRRQFTGIV